MKNKKMILAVAALAVVLALFIGVYFATRPDTQEGTKTFTVTVVHKDGTSKDFTCRTEEEKLGPALSAEGLIVEGASAGMYNTVDGETADYSVDGGYWAFYVGEEYASAGMDDTPVTDGGSYKLVYTIG